MHAMQTCTAVAENPECSRVCADSSYAGKPCNMPAVKITPKVKERVAEVVGLGLSRSLHVRVCAPGDDREHSC